MQDADYASVIGDKGFHGYLVGPSDSQTDQIVIESDDGREFSVPASALRRRTDGDWSLDEAVLSNYEVARPSGTEFAEEQVVPVVAEELAVGKRKRTTGSVRVGKDTTEREEAYSMPLIRERADVRRVLIDKPVDSAPPIRREGDTIVFPIVEEVAVVQKRLVLKEELHVSRRRTTEQHGGTVTLKQEQPVIERFDESGQRLPDEPVERTEPIATPEPVRADRPGIRSVIDPSVVRPSILGSDRPAQPLRRNKVLKDDTD